MKNIRIISILLLILVPTFLQAQKVRMLSDVKKNDTIPEGYAVIYGNFIQRLGFSSGGFPQDIRLINLDTGEIVSFRVTPTFKSAKENIFCYIIEPGSYAIYNYWWTQSKVYGGTMYAEPIYKNFDATDKKSLEKIVHQESLVQFSFSVTENSLNYLGTWNFDTGIVSFTDDKESLDNKMVNKYNKLIFSSANTVLPN